MSRIRVAALALLREGSAGEELLLVRKRGTTRFMLPGGKIEPGETAYACLARELSEELSLPLSEQAVPLGHFEAEAANEAGQRVEAAIFRQHHAAATDPTPAAEIAEVAWLPLSRTEPGLALAPLVSERLLPVLRAGPDPLRSA